MYVYGGKIRLNGCTYNGCGSYRIKLGATDPGGVFEGFHEKVYIFDGTHASPDASIVATTFAFKVAVPHQKHAENMLFELAVEDYKASDKGGEVYQDSTA